MSRASKRRAGIPRMLIAPRPATSPDEIIGLREVPGRLPRVDRLPGEPLPALAHRALELATGDGFFLAYPIHKGDPDAVRLA